MARPATRYQPLAVYGGFVLGWTLLFCVLLLLVLIGQYRERQSVFRAYVEDAFRDLDSELQATEAVLEGMSAFLRVVGDEPTAQTLRYAERVLSRYPFIHRIQVVRRVARADVPAFVASMRRHGYPDYRVRAYDFSRRSWTHPAERSEYYPIVLVAPAGKGRGVLMGLDLGSVPSFRAVLRKCRETGKAATSGPYELIGGGRGYLQMRSVSAANNAARANVFVATVVLARDLLRFLPAPGSGVVLTLRGGAVGGQGAAATLGRLGHPHAGAWLSRWFPRLFAVRSVRAQDQRLDLVVSERLGWWILPTPLLAAVVIASLLSLAILLAYARTLIRRDLERQRAQERLRYLANFDTLTGLPNRNLFRDRFQQALTRANRRRMPLALLYLDLDRFKQVNDANGHDAGDALLKSVAERLRESVRDEDTLARLSGDEFVILVEGIAERNAAETVGQKLRAAFQRPFDIRGRALRMGASIGIAVYPDDGEDASALLRKADQAMYRDKSSRRGPSAGDPQGEPADAC